MRARLIRHSTPKYRNEPGVQRQWIRPLRPVRPPAPLEEAEEVEFRFDGNALHVDGCHPLRA